VQVLVTGATGFIGRRLVPALLDDGHEVLAMTRRPEEYAGGGRPVEGDVDDQASLVAALAGCEAAYYLVHSLDQPDFTRRDAAAATVFGRAAAAAGVGQIIYLGGLGEDDDELSEHLRSRREVEHLLGAAGVPVTVLRAGIVVGHGSLGWDMLRQLVVRLPALITPQWVQTRCQPIAVSDAVHYLAGVLGLPAAQGAIFDIGGPEVLRYREMLARVAALLGRTQLLLPVPVLTPRLSSWWLKLVTDTDIRAARALIDSMTNEVVMREESIRALLPHDLLSFDDAARLALDEADVAHG